VNVTPAQAGVVGDGTASLLNPPIEAGSALKEIAESPVDVRRKQPERR
jgi:hypothetical protein